VEEYISPERLEAIAWLNQNISLIVKRNKLRMKLIAKERK